MFQSIKTNIQHSDERCLRSRRAFNVLKGGRKKAGLTLPTFDAIHTMKDTLKTRAAIEWVPSIRDKFNPFVATEARMVWQLGLLYYFLIVVALGDDADESSIFILQLLTGYVPEAIQDEKTLAMYKIYDYLDSESNDVFLRELFDGSIQTLQGMIDFHTLRDLTQWGRKSGCRSFPTVDLNKVEARGTKYTYDGRPLTKSKSLGRGTFGQVDLYTTSRNESVAIKTYFPGGRRGTRLAQRRDGFCDVQRYRCPTSQRQGQRHDTRQWKFVRLQDGCWWRRAENGPHTGRRGCRDVPLHDRTPQSVLL